MKEYKLILENEVIKKADLVKHMKEYFINYAMSVLVGRALPDVRDGLKPVHKRILFAMQGLGLTPDKGYRKCARVVGDVLGKFHPHSDTSVYDALVRMAQDFSMRYVLVDGHGNFGSIDGDSASAMRYTEARMDKLTMEMLRDINKNTVDFMPNFDGEEQEPTVLPSRYPNLLVNGSSGIAVGFKTDIPSHNLVEAIEQIIYQIDNPDCTIEDLVRILKAPDFGTGGYIVNPQDMLDMYTNGRGKVIMRGKYHIEDDTKIVFTEIPYGVNKTNLMISLIRLKDGYVKKVKDGKKTIDVQVKSKIPQIKELRDDSDGKTGIRIEITVDNIYNINNVLKLLFLNSDLQCNFNAIFTGVKGDKLYREINLKALNNFYIEHQKEIITRRSQFDLNKALDRQHILEGFVKALVDVDKAIKIIRSSKNKAEAIENLVSQINLSNKQAEAIVEMKLRRLTGMEIEEIQKELIEINQQVEFLQSILNNEQSLLNLLKDELDEIKEKYGDTRKSEILYEDNLENIDIKEVEISDYNCRIFYTNKYIKKHLKQSDNHKIVEGNTVLGDFTTTNKSSLLIFTNKERRYRIQCSDLEQYQPSAHGTFVPKLLGFENDEEIIKIVSVEKPTGFILVAYQDGNLAKIKIDKYLSSYKKLEKCYSNKSKVLDIYYSEKDVDILMVSDEGKGIIFNSSNFNAVGSTNSQGNCGMKLNEDGKVISAIIDINKEFNFQLETLKGKNKSFMLSDIAPTGKSTEERDLYTYLYSNKRGNQGNFLINTRTNEDKVISLIKR